MTTTLHPEVDFSELMSRLLGLLSEKEQDVIRRRFSLDGRKKETLDKIGRSYSITRERVRQIESVAIKKLARISKDPSMRRIHELAVTVLGKNGKMLSEDRLLSLMIAELQSASPIDANSIKLAMRVSDRIIKQEKNQHFYPFWRLAEVSLMDVKNLIKKVQKIMSRHNDVMSVEQIHQDLGKEYSLETVLSVLEIDVRFYKAEDGWGLSSWRHINPRSIKDKILITFKNLGKPMHFTQVVNHVLSDFPAKKMVTQQAIHNELIRHEDFVLVGRGIYALREWGVPAGTVCDLIRQVLQEHSEPMKRQEIIQAVMKKRDIRVGTISLNLQKYPFFKRVGRAVYAYEPTLDVRRRRSKSR